MRTTATTGSGWRRALRLRPLCSVLVLQACCLAGCGGSDTAPLEPAKVEALLETQLGIMASGIERENAELASQPVSSIFNMGANVALRYSNQAFMAPTPTVNSIQTFRGFFAAAFDINANISQSFSIDDITVNGDVATLDVTTDFNSTRLDLVPPQNTLARKDDLMVFQREGGTWRLVVWDEKLPPAEEPPAEEPPAEEPPVEESA